MDKAVLAGLGGLLDDYLGEFDGCFKTCATREHLKTYVRGQLGPLQRKSVEPIALDAGVPVRTLQEFLSVHRWDAGAMARRVREVVVRDHAHDNAIGVVDDTGCPKKGEKTVGVQRQYCGNTGKIDNCVTTVHLSYVTPELSTLVDCDIYLPKSWTDDKSRCEAAGVPADVEFRPKWKIALDLIARTRRDGIALRWLTTDESYGQVPAFLEGVAAEDIVYVAEVPRSMRGWTRLGRACKKKHRRVEKLWRRGGPSWTTFLVKDTTKGPVVWHARATRFIPSWNQKLVLWLIVAEEAVTGEMKYFLSNAPEDAAIADLLTVAFSRWNVERHFEDSKQEVGLDHFEVRHYKAVQRHFALSMASLLFLTRAAQALRRGEKGTWWPQLDVAADPRRDRTAA